MYMGNIEEEGEGGRERERDYMYICNIQGAIKCTTVHYVKSNIIMYSCLLIMSIIGKCHNGCITCSEVNWY